MFKYNDLMFCLFNSSLLFYLVPFEFAFHEALLWLRLAQPINLGGWVLIIDLRNHTSELSVLRDDQKIYKNIRKSLWQALGKHLDSSPRFPSETLCFSA